MSDTELWKIEARISVKRPEEKTTTMCGEKVIHKFNMIEWYVLKENYSNV